MKSLRTFFSLLMILFISSALLFGQQPVFKVLALKGDLKYSKGSANSWESLTNKTKLFEKDKVKLSNDAYLGLVHSSGRTLELKKGGVYDVNALAKSVAKKEENITKRLTSYVVKELTDADDLLKSSDYKKSMDITGSVERGISVDSQESDHSSSYFGKGFIKIASPKKSNIIESELAFFWRKADGVKSYKFTVYDRFDREVFSKVTDDTTLKVNLYSYNLEKEVYYFWNVSSADNPKVKSEDCAFLLLADTKVANIKDQLAKITKETGPEESALNKIVLASFYEENNLYFDALKCYQNAVRIVPDVEEYQKLYQVFLYKMNASN